MTSLSKSSSSFAAVFSAVVMILFLIAAAATTSISACGFDDTVQQQVLHDVAATPSSVVNGADDATRRASNYEKIRITVSTLDLDDSSKYCTASGESKPDFKGGSRTCTADDVFDADKKHALKNVIIPAAVKKLQDTLRVIRLTSNLQVGSTSQCTGGFTIPSSHVSPGIENTDYVIYVAAGPTAVGNVAFAGGCQEESTGTPKRIIVGRANFGPYYLSTEKMPISDAVNTMVHELLHAFGYSDSKFTERAMTTTMSVRGISKKVITAIKPRDEARDWMGCGSLPGVELENEGGSGTANSHVDARVYPDDIMAGAGGESLSVVTLAIMESLGVFLPYYNESEFMMSGYKAGCDWSTEACSNSVVQEVFCPATSSSDVGCTGNLKAYGPCSDSFLHDGCNYYNAYSNKKCYDESQTDDANTGDTFHNNSRCYKTSGTFKKEDSTSNPSNDKRCLKSQCFGNILSFTVGRDSVNYVTCQSKDQARSYSGFQGSVICPNITDMCNALKSSHNGSSTADSLNPIVPNTRGKTNRASDYIYTTKLTLTLSGSGWGNVIRNHYSDLFVAMQGDVAQVLNIESQQVWVMDVTGTSNQVQFIININDPSMSTTAIRGEFAFFLGRRAWMPRSANLYASKSGSSDNAVLGAAGASDKPSNACTQYMPSMEDTDECNGFIAGLVIAAIALLSLIVVSIYCCCCKYEDPPQTRKSLDRSVKYEVRPKRG